MHWPFADVFHNIKRKTLLVRSYTLTLLKGIPETDGIFRLLLSKEGPHRAKVDLVKSLSADISCCPNCSLLKEILKYVKILATFKVVYRPESLLGLGHLWRDPKMYTALTVAEEHNLRGMVYSLKMPRYLLNCLD